jgi:O-acetyl-ADP-ribose deacetylase (regulator of RNase III)
MEYKEMQGDLIELALKGLYDVVCHGCNCYCNMGAGIAVKFKEVFGADKFKLEGGSYRGDFNKLGQIDYGRVMVNIRRGILISPLQQEMMTLDDDDYKEFTVVNCYTQYGPGVSGHYGIPLDYDALRLCMRKLNREFKGKHIALPKIGGGLAKGDWNTISSIIKQELKDCKVTILML